MMSKASMILVLCEDKLQDVVIRRFLKKGWGHGPRSIRVIQYPSGTKGSAEQHVRDRYPVQLKALWQRSASTILIVAIDADTGSVAEHHNELLQACLQADNGPVPRTADEPVVHIVPRRNIETWLAYLNGDAVDETVDYKIGRYDYKRRESDCHPLVDRLAECCKERTPLEAPPDSLSSACVEFERIRAHL